MSILALRREVIEIPKNYKYFCISEHFNEKNEIVKFSHISESFKRLFTGLYVSIRPEQKLLYYDLVNGPCLNIRKAIVEMGGSIISTDLFSVYYLMLQQPSGCEDGTLLVNGCSNYFFTQFSLPLPELLGINKGPKGWVVSLTKICPSDLEHFYSGHRIFRSL